MCVCVGGGELLWCLSILNTLIAYSDSENSRRRKKERAGWTEERRGAPSLTVCGRRKRSVFRGQRPMEGSSAGCKRSTHEGPASACVSQHVGRIGWGGAFREAPGSSTTPGHGT